MNGFPNFHNFVIGQIIIFQLTHTKEPLKKHTRAMYKTVNLTFQLKMRLSSNSLKKTPFVGLVFFHHARKPVTIFIADGIHSIKSLIGPEYNAFIRWPYFIDLKSIMLTGQNQLIKILSVVLQLKSYEI